MDLLNRLADKVNFTFEVHLSEDGSYGSLRRVRTGNAQFQSCRKNVLLVNQASKWWFEVVDKPKRYSLGLVECLVIFHIQTDFN